MLGAHCTVGKDSILVGRYFMSNGKWFHMFRNIIIFSCSRVQQWWQL